MTSEINYAILKNGYSFSLADIPVLKFDDFKQTILKLVAKGMRVSAMFGDKTTSKDNTVIYAILSDDKKNSIYAFQTIIKGDSFDSLTPECPQVHLFEREIAEQYGLIPVGHPWLKPVRYHHSWTNRDAWGRKKSTSIDPGSGQFFQVDGEQVHEVAVGPVHAGIIEPGHFRFQCQGEEVLHLEIALGYQHRGIEEAMIGGPNKKSIHYMETTSGDTTIGHAHCYVQAIEALSDTRKSARGLVLRGIMLELERIANHVGDLGAFANDVGFQPTSSFCGHIRGDWLNLTALLCGNRFGRGMIVPGGVKFDINEEQLKILKERIEILEKETEDAINLIWENLSVLNRFEDTGIVSKQTALDLGLVGPVARASGLQRDARVNLPSGIFEFSNISISSCMSGDVFARAYVRWLEIRKSIEFIKSKLEALPKGTIKNSVGKLKPQYMVVTMNEGWRGEICHVAITDDKSKFKRYKIVDPSFHNWMGLAMALRNEEISDFPICNKSFNLSYCGHDL